MQGNQRDREGRPQAPREGDGANEPGQEQGISPRDPRSMPRAEDDEETFANSPEYHDRPDATTPRDPGRRPADR